MYSIIEDQCVFLEYFGIWIILLGKNRPKFRDINLVLRIQTKILFTYCIYIYWILTISHILNHSLTIRICDGMRFIPHVKALPLIQDFTSTYASL